MLHWTDTYLPHAYILQSTTICIYTAALLYIIITLQDFVYHDIIIDRKSIILTNISYTFTPAKALIISTAPIATASEPTATCPHIIKSQELSSLYSTCSSSRFAVANSMHVLGLPSESPETAPEPAAKSLMSRCSGTNVPREMAARIASTRHGSSIMKCHVRENGFFFMHRFSTPILARTFSYNATFYSVECYAHYKSLHTTLCVNCVSHAWDSSFAEPALFPCCSYIAHAHFCSWFCSARAHENNSCYRACANGRRWLAV